MVKMKCYGVKRSNTFLHFNEWFEQEHDYCIPLTKRSKIVTGEDDKYSDKNSKPLELNLLSDNLKNKTNLEKINVNNELSSCSLYAIDVTTELLKDALIKNVKKKSIFEQSTVLSEDCVASSDNYVPNIQSEPDCGENYKTPRLNSKNTMQPSDSINEKVCVSKRSTPPNLFLPMDIDGDMIKLFPTLDFSTEHHLNVNLEDTENKEITKSIKNIISPRNTKDTTNENKLSFSTSLNDIISKSPEPLLIKNNKNKFKVDVTQLIPPNSSQTLSYVNSVNMINWPQLSSEQYIQIFNRYQGNLKKQFIEQVEDPGPLLLKDLLCGTKPKTIVSPYTQRYLKPFIYRDSVTKPLWLQLLDELKEYFRKKKGFPKSMKVETIDYCYVRAKHIKSVNALAREFFWPGIDLSESLLYPDFSVVVLYKNLVIGFGFMVPDIKTNENYITFLFTRPCWTNCGIAKFMLYHLIQTCMTRDITLHVSPDNSAMILYQKFGFKIEEFVQNFYEHYIPENSKKSKHALFLRLRSTVQSK